MKPRGSVKMIQQEREAKRITLPFCHLEKKSKPIDHAGHLEYLRQNVQRTFKYSRWLGSSEKGFRSKAINFYSSRSCPGKFTIPLPSTIRTVAHLSANEPQKGALRNSIRGLIPTNRPHCPAFMPICLKYTPIRGNREPKAE